MPHETMKALIEGVKASELSGRTSGGSCVQAWAI